MPTRSATLPDLSDLEGEELLNRAIETYYTDIVRAVGRRNPANGSALDVVHDLYVKLASRPDVLREKRSIKAYLCRAAINLGIDRQRREQFEATLFSGHEHEAHNVAEDIAAPDRALDVEARLSVLRRAIGELPARRRAVFIMHRLGRQSPDQIAAKLNISRNMVDRHLRRALSHCLDRLLELD